MGWNEPEYVFLSNEAENRLELLTDQRDALIAIKATLEKMPQLNGCLAEDLLGPVEDMIGDTSACIDRIDEWDNERARHEASDRAEYFYELRRDDALLGFRS